MYMSILPACMSVPVCVQCPRRPEEDIRSSGTSYRWLGTTTWLFGRTTGKKIWNNNSEKVGVFVLSVSTLTAKSH